MVHCAMERQSAMAMQCCFTGCVKKLDCPSGLSPEPQMVVHMHGILLK